MLDYHAKNHGEENIAYDQKPFPFKSPTSHNIDRATLRNKVFGEPHKESSQK
jgi:hypothetical protein